MRVLAMLVLGLSVAAGSYTPRSGMIAPSGDGAVVAVGSTYAAGDRTLGAVRYTRTGRLDPGFATGGRFETTLGSRWGAYTAAVGIRPDGRIVVIGGTTVELPDPAHCDVGERLALVQLRPNGRFDPSFGDDGTVLEKSPDVVVGGGLEPDGSVVVVTAPDCATGTNSFTVRRYAANGARRAEVVRSTKLTPAAVALAHDGSLVVAGPVVSPVAAWKVGLVRYRADGSLDHAVAQSFAGGAGVLPGALALGPDGKIVVGIDGRGTIARFTTAGALDTTFGRHGEVPIPFARSQAIAFAVQQDGKVVVAGTRRAGGRRVLALARYSESGMRDTTFGTGGVALDPEAGPAEAVTIRDDGSIAVLALRHVVALYTTKGLRTKAPH